MPAFKKLCLCFVCTLCSLQLIAQSLPPAKSYKLFFEKVYLHTDRDLYASGDDIWFKAYLVNAQNNQTIGISNNLYVELLSPQGRMLNREIIRLDYGLGNGDIKLTDSIPTGKYRLRAYTNWMRNFGDNFIFEKSIDIVNVVGKQTEDAEPQVTKSSIAINFYPEGGSLIQDVTSIVAVKAIGANGLGIAVKGSILNTIGDTVTMFNTDTLGMGLFTLLPLKGQNYHYAIATKAVLNNTMLPVALTSGFSLSVLRGDTLVNIVVNANDAARAQYNGKVFNVSGRHSGVLCLFQPIKITGNQLIMRVPKSFFLEGITTLTLLDDENKPHSERLVYIHHADSVAKLTLMVNKKSYATREKATISIKLNDTTSKANVSLTVVDESVSPVPVSNINSYLMLQSELRGNIENPAQYFDTTNVNRFKQLDLLLLTQGWRDFVWRRIADTAIHLSYAAETGFDISGQLRTKFADKPIINTNVVLSVLGAQQKMYLAKTDSLGKYNFTNLFLRDSAQLVLSGYSDKHKKVGLITLDTSNMAHPLTVNKALTANDYTINKAQIDEVIKNKVVSKFSSPIQLKTVNIKDSKFVTLMDMQAIKFGYPDEVFNITPKDYDYKNVRDYILHESKQARSDINDGEDKIVFVGDRGISLNPRLFVNNKEMPFTDSDPAEVANSYYNIYWNIPMNMVTKILIQKLLQPPNMTITPSANYMTRISPITTIFIIYLTLKPNALDNLHFDTATHTAGGYYQSRVFYKPVYDIKSDLTKIDLRKTIHWEPNIILSKNGTATINFYNADTPNKMRYIVEGVTDKGKLIAASSQYQVK